MFKIESRLNYLILLAVIAITFIYSINCYAYPDENPKYLNNHLAFYCRFENTTTADYARGTAAAAYINGTIAYTTGIYGQAAQMDGSNYILYNAASNFNTPEGTMSFWIQPVNWNWNDTSTYHYFVWLENNDLFDLQTLGSTQKLGFVGGSSSEYFDPAIMANENISSWANKDPHFITITWKNGVNRLFIDGESIGNPLVWSKEPSSLGSYIKIAAQRYGTSTNTKYNIDEFKIYDIAVTANDAADLYMDYCRTLYSTFDLTNFQADQAVGTSTASWVGTPTTATGLRGNSPKVNLNNRISYSIADGNMSIDKGTLSFWVKPDNWNWVDTSYWHNLLWLRSTDSQSIMTVQVVAGAPDSGKATLAFMGCGNGTLSYNGTTQANHEITDWNNRNWHNIAVTWDFTGGLGVNTLFIDGEQVDDKIWATCPNPGATYDYINMGSNFFTLPPNADYLIDELKIFDSVLTEKQIKTLACEGALLLSSSFDRASDFNADFAIGSTTGTAYPTSTSVTRQSGVNGSAARLNKSNYLSYGSSGNFNTSEGTMMFWAKPVDWFWNDFQNGSGQNHYFVNLDYGSGGHAMEVQTVSGYNDLGFLGGSSDALYYSESTMSHINVDSWANTDWRHITVSWQNGENNLFVNGTLVDGPKTWATVPTNIGSYIKLGVQRFGSPTYSDFLMDEFKVYSTKLSSDEIAHSYENSANYAQSQYSGQLRNLISSKYCASTIPSSKTPASPGQQYLYAAENIMDGNYGTIWKSGTTATSTTPNWMEVRWPQLVSINRITVVEDSTGGSSYQYEIKAWVNGAWTSVVAKKSSPTAGTLIEEKFSSVNTTRIRYYMYGSSGTGAATSIKEMAAYGSDDWTNAIDKITPATPAWQSGTHWISGNENFWYNFAYRKKFNISASDYANLSDAVLQIAGGDYCRELWINGDNAGTVGKVTTNNKMGTVTTLIDVKSLLVSGDNIIAVTTGNLDGLRGLIAELTLNKNDGTCTRIVTNYGTGTWRVYNRSNLTTNPPDVGGLHWYELNFDDTSTGWQDAQLAYIESCGIAGDIMAKYKYSDQGPREFAKIGSITVSSNPVTPGSEITVSATLQTKVALSNDLAFKFSIGNDSVPMPDYNLPSNFIISSKMVMPSVPTSQWQINTSYTVSAKLWIPDWAPHDSAMPVRISVVGNNINGNHIQGSSYNGQVGTINIQRFSSLPSWSSYSGLPYAQFKYDANNPTPTLYVKRYITGTGFETEEKICPDIMTEGTSVSYEGLGSHANMFGTTSTILSNGKHLWRCAMYKFVKSGYDNDQLGCDAENVEFQSDIDQKIRAILAVDPNAYIIVSPILRADSTWTCTHDTSTRREGMWHSDLSTKEAYSLSSTVWKAQQDYDITSLINFLAQQSYAPHIVGMNYEMAGETYYWGSYDTAAYESTRSNIKFGDWSPAHVGTTGDTAGAFRTWLQSKYATDAALQTAWHVGTSVTRSNAYPNLTALRGGSRSTTPSDFFIDPAAGTTGDATWGKMSMDYWEFHSHQMAQRAKDVAAKIKEVSNTNGGRRLICGLWGFYSNGWNYGNVYPGTAAQLGGWDLQDILADTNIDYLAGLQSYRWVNWGTPMVPNNLSESIRRHGKGWLTEYDMRTYFVNEAYCDLATNSDQESETVMERDLAAAALKGDSCWWVSFPDLTSTRTGIPWYSMDNLKTKLADLKKVYYTVYQQASKDSIAQVAVFMNNDDVYTLDPLYTHRLQAAPTYNLNTMEFPWLGTPVDYYLLDDIRALSSTEFSQYKVFVFASAYNVTAAQKTAINNVAKQTGKTVVWLYAPGYVNLSSGTLSVSDISTLTGITINKIAARLASPEINVTSNNKKIKPAKWEFDSGSYSYEIGPVFYVNDAGATTRGYFTNSGYTSRVGYASKTVNGSTTYFVALPFMTRSVMRDICTTAGVSMYTSVDAMVDASKNYLLITAGSSGFNSNVTVPANSYVYDIWARSYTLSGGSTFTPNIAANKTGFYFVGTQAEASSFVTALTNQQ